MPDGNPSKVEGDDAQTVAQYIFDAFYSPNARLRNHPPRIEYARLTVRQHETSLADLARGHGEILPTADSLGLNAVYFRARSADSKEKAFERIDACLSFDVGTAYPAGLLDSVVAVVNTNAPARSPDKGPPASGSRPRPQPFAINWEGSLVAEETGTYEIIVESENGYRLWLNNPARALIDNYVAPASGIPTVSKVSLRLLGGRAYPIRIEYFRHEDATASFALRWIPPHGAEMPIPADRLLPKWTAPTFVMTTPFPPDDSSVGYPRGTSVSAAWQRATALAALEAATYVVQNIDRLSQCKAGESNRAERLQAYGADFAARAFRRALTDDERVNYVASRFAKNQSPEVALRETIMTALVSPWFLYPEPIPQAPRHAPSPYAMASRLAFALWDSVPDTRLTAEVVAGRLDSPAQVTQQARRMLMDPRAKTKVHTFFHHWLHMETSSELRKDETLFPGFDARMVSDLRRSLNRFVDSVVWSESSDYRQLMLSETLFMNPHVAEFYGAEHSGADTFEAVQLRTGPRAGVLTHPYLLALHAYHESTSPIHRGVFVTRHLLGRDLMPPPMAVVFDKGDFSPDLTMREKVTQLTRPQSCMGCHAVINPLGFSLEHYDAVGRFRTHENSEPVESGGFYETESGETVELKGVRDLAEHIVSSRTAHRGFVIKLFNQIAHQPIQAYGEDVLNGFVDEFQSSGYNIQQLIVRMAVMTALHTPDGPES